LSPSGESETEVFVDGASLTGGLTEPQWRALRLSPAWTYKAFGRTGAAIFGVFCSLSFLSRHEETRVSIAGAIITFGLAAGWILVVGRIRLWMIASGPWDKEAQGLAFLLVALGIPAMGIVVVAFLFSH
jgi:hypothetical protein